MSRQKRTMAGPLIAMALGLTNVTLACPTALNIAPTADVMGEGAFNINEAERFHRREA